MSLPASALLKYLGDLGRLRYCMGHPQPRARNKNPRRYISCMPGAGPLGCPCGMSRIPPLPSQLVPFCGTYVSDQGS